MKVVFFARIATAAGAREEDWTIAEPLSLDAFWAELERRHPGLAVFRGACRVARNFEYCAPEDTLQPGDEIALIPPVSGG